MKVSQDIFIVSAPSGVGKTTLNRRLLAEFKDKIAMSVSLTTRPQRPNEVEGEHYRFVTLEQFQQAVSAGKMLEWAEIFGNTYGTSLDEIRRIQNLHRDVLLEIDVQGWHYAKKKIPEGISIFILPPCAKTLWHRLNSRGTESDNTLINRFLTAEQELREGANFDHFVLNDDIEKAYKDLKNIIIFREDGIWTKEQGIKHCQDLLAEFANETWIQELRKQSVM
jgi:guanylate kinase